MSGEFVVDAEEDGVWLDMEGRLIGPSPFVEEAIAQGKGTLRADRLYDQLKEGDFWITRGLEPDEAEALGQQLIKAAEELRGEQHD